MSKKIPTKLEIDENKIKQSVDNSVDNEFSLSEKIKLMDTVRELTEQVIEKNRILAKLMANGSTREEKATINDEIRFLLAKRDNLEESLKLTNHQRSLDSSAKDDKLLPIRHKNRDFFLADLFDYTIKDDGATMEAPIFSLSTKPDLSIWKWTNKDGSKSVEVYPSIKGRATLFDIRCINLHCESINCWIKP